MEIYLYRLIEEQGTSISAIAKEMGVSIQYISNIARGQRVSIKILERVAGIIGVPAWRLLCPPEDDPITQARPDAKQVQKRLQEQERERKEIGDKIKSNWTKKKKRLKAEKERRKAISERRNAAKKKTEEKRKLAMKTKIKELQEQHHIVPRKPTALPTGDESTTEE